MHGLYEEALIRQVFQHGQGNGKILFILRLLRLLHPLFHRLPGFVVRHAEAALQNGDGPVVADQPAHHAALDLVLDPVVDGPRLHLLGLFQISPQFVVFRRVPGKQRLLQGT